MIRVYKYASRRRRRFIRVGVVAVAIALFGYASFQVALGLKRAQSWVIHTYTVKEELQDALGNLVDMETGQRGYVLTGSKGYLQPYARARLSLVNHMSRLKFLLSDNANQVHDLADLQNLINVRLSEMEETIAFRKFHTADQAAELVKSNSEKRYMESIRSQIAEMQRKEDLLLQLRLSKLKRYFVYMAAVLGGVLVLALFLLLQLFGLLGSLEEKEKDLRKANDELEERVKSRTEELSRSNQELERFAYVSSHDLQEPLRKIAMFAQLLQIKHAKSLDKEASGYLAIIGQGVSRMQNLIHDLLEYSRVNTAATSVQDVDLKETMGGVLTDLDVAIKETGAVIECEDLPVVRGNPTHMHQLFQNLIGNAIKFQTPNVAPLIRITSKYENGFWTVSVQDNGIGIDSRYSEKIFEAFQRLHQKDKYPGTGIGLAICKKIAQQNGGSIWVTSVPKEGSTFHVTLPVAAAKSIAMGENENAKRTATT